MEVSLKDKVIIVTGSTKGIGKALAESFMENGAIVVVNYHKDDRQAETMCQSKPMALSNAIIIKADVSKEKEVIRLCNAAKEKFGKIDVLINNVGICRDSDIINMSTSQWNDVLTVNLTSAFICTKYVANEMITQNYGKIINVASLKGIIGCEKQINYSASKAGMIGFTKSLAKELGKYNISVNAICPGYIETDLNRNITEKKFDAKRRSTLEYKYALNDLVAFTTVLCSDEINGVSGQVFNIDSRIM